MAGGKCEQKMFFIFSHIFIYEYRGFGSWLTCIFTWILQFFCAPKPQKNPKKKSEFTVLSFCSFKEKNATTKEKHARKEKDAHLLMQRCTALQPERTMCSTLVRVASAMHKPVDVSLLQTVFNCRLQVTNQLLCCSRLRLHQLQSCGHWQRTDVCFCFRCRDAGSRAEAWGWLIYRESACSGLWSGCCSGSSAAGWCSWPSHPLSA